MKVLEKGRPQKGWAIEQMCTGRGNKGGGCGAKLLVEEGDLYKTYSQALHETDTHVTFARAECGVETDLPNGILPGTVFNKLPDKTKHRDASGPGGTDVR